MIDDNVLRNAEKLARRISETPSITEAEIAEDAATRALATVNAESAALIVQLAKWASPFFTEAERNLRETHGGLLAAVYEQKGPHKNDTGH